ncbi:MAG: DUF484 family protein [Robiginitomaculum sp.]|nr:DUF484 family protein [Robiginitomaculum sp.]
MKTQAKILDFEAASRVRMLERVRSLTMTRDALVETARQNHATQAQVHAAILTVLDAKNWQSLDARLRSSVRAGLGSDFLHLFVEKAKIPVGLSNITAKPEGFVAHIMQGHFERLGACSSSSAMLYGEEEYQMKSEAIVRLDWGPGEALLVFASKDRRVFSAGQGTELIAFFAKAIERIISRWA